MKSCITALICGCISGIIIGLIAIRPISTTIPKATQSQPVIYDTIRCTKLSSVLGTGTGEGGAVGEGVIGSLSRLGLASTRLIAPLSALAAIGYGAYTAWNWLKDKWDLREGGPLSKQNDKDVQMQYLYDRLKNIADFEYTRVKSGDINEKQFGYAVFGDVNKEIKNLPSNMQNLYAPYINKGVQSFIDGYLKIVHGNLSPLGINKFKKIKDLNTKSGSGLGNTPDVDTKSSTVRGVQPKNIILNFNKDFIKLDITNLNTKESASEIERIVTEAVLNGINSGQLLLGK